MFLTICRHQFGWISERGGKLFKFASERRGYPERGGSPQKRGGSQGGVGRGGVPTLQETEQSYSTPNHAIANAYSLKHPSA